jgi:putative ABC transport system permease protein
MSQRIPLAWLQLRHEKMKLFAAVAGVMVSVVLMWMQLGLLQALFSSAVEFHGSVNGELIVIHGQYEYLLRNQPFSSRLLHRLLGSPHVKEIYPIYTQPLEWKNPWTGEVRTIQCYGIDTDKPAMNLPMLAGQMSKLRQTDVFLYDRKARPGYGPVLEEFARGTTVEPEINRRKMTMVGLIELGPSFGADANIIVSQANFLRLVAGRSSGQIDFGVIKLQPGSDVAKLQSQFQAILGNEVDVLTRDELCQRELVYWRRATPIGVVFTTGTFVGFFIGFIVVYQILYTDVTTHLPHFATMKAMGFSDGYLFRMVISQSLQLAILGFVPGSLIAGVLYTGLRSMTQLPLRLEFNRGIFLLAATILMCTISGALAIRKLRTADPADVF